MTQDLLQEVAQRGGRYLDEMHSRRVAPSFEAIRRLHSLDILLQEEPIEPQQVLAELDEIGSPATVASTSGRYFGFVTGGSLPAALEVMSPVASALEEICRKWLVSILGLPAEAGVGFVTGATMGNFTGLAAARHAVLERVGWDPGWKRQHRRF